MSPETYHNLTLIIFSLNIVIICSQFFLVLKDLLMLYCEYFFQSILIILCGRIKVAAAFFETVTLHMFY